VPKGAERCRSGLGHKRHQKATDYSKSLDEFLQAGPLHLESNISAAIMAVDQKTRKAERQKANYANYNGHRL
jgi:hypothetical protein